MSIEHVFGPGTVVCDLHSTDKYDAIREVIHRAAAFREIPDARAFEEAVLSRERLQSTGLGHGVAVAHGRMPGITRIMIGLGLSRHGVSFDAPDRAPVHLLFVIASPAGVTLDYLQALSTLVRCVRRPSFRDALIGAPAAEVVEERIREAFAASSDDRADLLPGTAGSASS
jgi:nitrogen PTS system EIIA component